MATATNAANVRHIATENNKAIFSIDAGRGRTAYFDEADADLVFRHNWTSNARYAVTRIDGKITPMHRLIMECPDGLFVDHIDGDGFNNHRSNLRICTHQENMRNRHSTCGASRFKGVTRHGSGWRARINVGGKKVAIGTFRSECEAAKAYDASAIEKYGEFARTNADLNLY